MHRLAGEEPATCLVEAMEEARTQAMYERFFGLDEPPFRLTPDPRYFFLSRKHRDALGHLVYGIREGAGFVAITGEIGAGKTTLLRKLLREEDDGTLYAYVMNPVLTGVELLQEINHELALPVGESRREMLGHLNQFLLERKREGRNVVLVIDEAQALDGAILEQLRMLSNFETETAKLMQIVLVGQPELRDLLLRPDLQQLNQRITVRWHLGALDREETAQYVEHRLAIASGGPPRRLFTRAALRQVHAGARGIPRLINLLCHRALLRAYASDRAMVTSSIVRRAMRELEDPLRGKTKPRRMQLAMASAAVVIAGTAAFAFFAPWSPWARPTASLGMARDEATAALPPAAPPPIAAGTTASVGAATGANIAADGDPAAATAPTSSALGAGPVTVASTDAIRVSPVELDITPPRAASPIADPGPVGQGVTAERLAFLHAVEQSSVGQSAYDATEALLRAWSVEPLSPSEASGSSLDLPEIARRRGLRYLALQGNLNTLRVLDLPAILEVAPDDGSAARFVTLERLSERDARVAVGRDSLEMTPLVLAEAWFGKAHLFWRDLDRLGPFLAMGASSDAVYRLHERLRAAGVYAGGPSDYFAPDTEGAVLRFQQQERLVADGKVGPMTLIALYQRTSPEDLPHLGERSRSAGLMRLGNASIRADDWVGTWEDETP